MSAGLDMSLDEIIAKRKPRGTTRTGGPTRTGGISKRSGGPVRNPRSPQNRTRPYTGTSSTTPNIAASPEGKILVSNLAYKVSEADLWAISFFLWCQSWGLPSTYKPEAKRRPLYENFILSSTSLLRLAALEPGESETFSYNTLQTDLPCCSYENNPPDRKTNSLPPYTHFDTLTSFQHQELFQTMIGPVRQVNLNFDQSGRSKGTASVVFARKNDAVRSVEKLRNITLD
ncbi:6472_t:CDS:2, partial [Acaulospora morrowiae]